MFFTVSQSFADKPSPPGVPTVTEIGGDFVNLSWEKPLDDGGSRIQGYLIDKREIDSDTWQRVNAAICVATQINISNLIEGRQYVFRVFAQNEAGLSLPSQASNTVTIKDPLSIIDFFHTLEISLCNFYTFFRSSLQLLNPP